MGVVRDVTIDQLTRAVQGISSNGISDSTGQAINNTLGTLGKDTSLQGIITALTNLAGTITPSASNVTFDNTGTGLSASNVQTAITELTQVVEAVIQPMNNKFTQRDAFKAVQKCGWITIKSFVNITTAVNASESFAKITLPTIGGSVLAVNSNTKAIYPCSVASNGSVVSDGSMPTGYYYFYGNIIAL